MPEAKYYVEIKDKKIPTIVRNYKNKNSVKIFFSGNILNISKSKYLSTKKMMKLLMENEDKIYEQYLKILSLENKTIKHWNDGESFLYRGEIFKVRREYTELQRIYVSIKEESKEVIIKLPNIKLEDEYIKKNIDKKIKEILKMETELIMIKRLPYWSEKTGIRYKSFKIRDSITKYGSCKPDTKELYFSSRLAMLPQEKIDAVIVHELCHIIHKNHGKDFYKLLKKYIPNYEEIDIWLKNNAKELVI